MTCFPSVLLPEQHLPSQLRRPLGQTRRRSSTAACQPPTTVRPCPGFRVYLRRTFGPLLQTKADLAVLDMVVTRATLLHLVYMEDLQLQLQGDGANQAQMLPRRPVLGW